ncbi:MAG: hypothetical protein WCP58_04880 [bacterium]
MATTKERIAVTFEGKDCLRIIPLPSKNGNAAIKFHFFDDTYVIRKFNFNHKEGGLTYIPEDFGQAKHEISYHSANNSHSSPILLPKYKDGAHRIPISDEIIDLNFRQIVVPIPVCRITTNVAPTKEYRTKDSHWRINLTDKYNSTDIYIAGREYNYEEMRKLFPMILDSLFPITTIDFLIYGAGMATEPIFNKMFENAEPVNVLTSTIVGEYQIFCRTYQLVKTDVFRMYAKPEYCEKNFVEFFNNIDYLDLLATTSVCCKLTMNRTTPPRPAYEYDIENLKRIGYDNNYIMKFSKRFLESKNRYTRLNKFRSGIIISL